MGSVFLAAAKPECERDVSLWSAHAVIDRSLELSVMLVIAVCATEHTHTSFRHQGCAF